MFNRLLLTGVLVLAIVTAGGVAAQGPDRTPADVVQNLVNQGLFSSADGKTVAEIGSHLMDLSNASRTWEQWPLTGGPSVSDFVFSTEITWGDAPDTAYSCGVTFGQISNKSYTLVEIDRQGQLTLAQVSVGIAEPVSSEMNSDIDTGESAQNQIIVTNENNTLHIFVNGQHAGEFASPGAKEGLAGLAMRAEMPTDGMSCTFANTWLWRPTPPPAVLSVATPVAGQPAQSSRTTPTLTAYDGTPEEAMAELARLGIVPSGGSEIFREPYAFFTGTGSWFTPLASYKPHTHIVMAGELSFTVGSMDEAESCSLLARIATEGNMATTFVNVGLSNTGSVLAYEKYDGRMGNFHLGTERETLDQPHHVLFMLFGDKLTVYLDGEPVVVNMIVRESSGTYGIALIGYGDNARCEGHNIWAWEVDAPIAFGDGCGAIVDREVNLRTGPGTDYDRAGSLTAGQTALIVGKATGSDGFVWWKLESGDWVRSDIVTAGGSCTAVSEVAVP